MPHSGGAEVASVGIGGILNTNVSDWSGASGSGVSGGRSSNLIWPPRNEWRLLVSSVRTDQSRQLDAHVRLSCHEYVLNLIRSFGVVPVDVTVIFAKIDLHPGS